MPASMNTYGILAPFVVMQGIHILQQVLAADARQNQTFEFTASTSQHVHIAQSLLSRLSVPDALRFPERRAARSGGHTAVAVHG